MLQAPCILQPWICIWCCKWPMLLRQSREAKAQCCTLQDTVLDPATCQPERVGGISVLKTQQLVYLFLHSWLPASLPCQPNSGQRPSCTWEGSSVSHLPWEQCEELLPALQRWWLLCHCSWGNWALEKELFSPARTLHPAPSFISWPGSMLQDMSISEATGLLHWMR